MECKDEDTTEIGLFLFLVFSLPLGLQAHQWNGFWASLLQKDEADGNNRAKVIWLSPSKEGA